MLNQDINFPGRTSLFFVFSLSLSIFFILSSFVFGGISAAAEEHYELTGENINYDYQAGLIIVEGEARFARGEIKVISDSLEFNFVSGDILARGEPVKLVTPDEVIEGKSLKYNYYDREGELAGARSQINEVNVEGDTIKIVRDQEYKLKTEEAMLTPCIVPDPHYRLEAERILFYPEDRLVAEQVSLWWGDTSLITLPAYVVQLEEDDETGEFRPIVPPSLIYELGYDWRDGLIFEARYPYEIEGLTEGQFYFKDTTGAVREISVTNELFPAAGIILDTFYQRTEQMEGGEFVWQENYGTEILYNFSDSHSVRLGYDYGDDKGEKEEVYYLGWNYKLSPSLEVKQLLQYKQWESQESEQVREERHPLTTSVNYEHGDSQRRFDLHYDFYTQQWRHEYLWQEDLAEKAFLSLYQDYQDQSLERQKYKYSQQIGPNKLSDFSLRYQKGYETDFLPYIQFQFVRSENFTLDIGFGRLAENDKMVGQIAFNPTWQYSWQPVSDLDLSTKFSYHQFNYSSPASPNYFRALETEFKLEYDFTIGSNVEAGISLLRRENFTDGSAFLEKNEIDKTLQYGLSGELDISTPAPESGITLGLKSDFNMYEQDWDDFVVKAERYLDCYSYYGEYDLQRQSFRAGFSFDL